MKLRLKENSFEEDITKHCTEKNWILSMLLWETRKQRGCLKEFLEKISDKDLEYTIENYDSKDITIAADITYCGFFLLVFNKNNIFEQIDTKDAFLKGKNLIEILQFEQARRCNLIDIEFKEDCWNLAIHWIKKDPANINWKYMQDFCSYEAIEYLKNELTKNELTNQIK